MEQQSVELSLHDQLLTWFEQNKKNVITGAVISLVATFGYFLYADMQERKQVEAGEALTKALLEEYQTGGGSADGYLKVAGERAGTASGGQAVLLAASSLYKLGKFSDAQAQFERYMREYPGTSFGGHAQLGVAASLHAQGKLDEALAAYKSADRPGSATEVQSKFGQAAVYLAQNKPDQALSLYESVVQLTREFGNSPLASEAMNRAIEIRSKLPSVAVPVTASPSAPMKLLSSTNSPAAK